jgi:hypothetical protein
MSWVWFILEIIVPAAMNRSALKKACVIKWKKARVGINMASVVIIKPSWLSVDRAMIFLRSVSVLAASLDISIVAEPRSRRAVIILMWGA